MTSAFIIIAKVFIKKLTKHIIYDYVWSTSFICSVPRENNPTKLDNFYHFSLQQFLAADFFMVRRKKKCSLFPLTSPKKLGTVGRHNFFFLINFFFFFFNESYSFSYCKHVHFLYYYFNWLKKQIKHHYLDELSAKLRKKSVN